MAIGFRERSRWLATHVLPHEPALRAWLRRTTRILDADIDDIVQETYAILAKLETVDTIRDPRTYAFQVARSVFLQGLRRRKVVTIESIVDLNDLQVADDRPSPEQQALGHRELRRVKDAIAAMPPQVGKVFWARRVEGMSQRETAQRLGLAEHTVEKYTARGLKILLVHFAGGGNPVAESSTVGHLMLVGSEPKNDRARTGE